MTDDLALALALVAAAVGVAALVGVIVVGLSLRRLRTAQTMLLPDGGHMQLVDAYAELDVGIRDVRSAINELRELVDGNAQYTRDELATVIRFQGLERYDAYSDMGGGQSWSLALLDQRGTGTVISCLHARDHARVYVKYVVEGASPQRLSPEEQRAITQALTQRR